MSADTLNGIPSSVRGKIRRVQRRLALQRFLGVLGWCWLAAMLAAAAVIAAARFYPLGIVDWQWLAGFLAAGLVAAGGWTFFASPPTLQAALEIDHRFGLQERVSSTLTMSRADRESEAGQALIADADARLRRIAVLERFPVRPPRHLLLPLVPGLLLAAVMIFRPPMPEMPAAATEAATQPPAEVRRSAEDLRQKLVERHTQAEKAGLKEAAKLLQRLEEGTKELAAQTNRDNALVKLNDLARELQERRKQLSGGEALRQQMEPVQGIAHGPADDLAKALSRGDFSKASQALEELQNKLSNSQLDTASKAELARQFQQLKQKIDQMAQQATDAQADLQKRADQMKPVDRAAADKLEEEVQKLQQQGPQMETLESLAKQLGQCSRQIEQGQNAQAAQAMRDALQQIDKLASRQSERKTLDGAMEQLSDAKRQINGEQRDGEGKNEGTQAGHNGEADELVAEPGRGPGKERGRLTQSSAKSSGTLFNSHVPQSVGKGAGQVTGLTDGPNLKNQAEAEIQKAAAEVEHGSTDPLSGLHLPKKQAEHVREYFDSFREGK